MGILRKQSIAMLSRQTIHLFLLGISILIFAVACSGNVDRGNPSLSQLTENCRVVQHMMGETCIPRNPDRIATLWMATFQSALGLVRK
jgi:iron complex transport system substrate-binding protein